MDNPWKVQDSQTVYENSWIKVDDHKVLNPKGNPGIYGKVHFKHLAIGVIPLDINLHTWIVGQYRFPLDAYSWEIPEGGGALDVDPIVSAQRELLEETGIRAQKFVKILDLHLSNSVSDELGMVFVATDLSFEKAAPEETEELQVKKLSFDELFSKVMKGEITDSLSVAGVFKLKFLLDQKQIKC